MLIHSYSVFKEMDTTILLQLHREGCNSYLCSDFFQDFFSLSLFFYTIRCSFILFFKINSVLCSLSFLDLFIIALFQIFLLFLFLFFWHSCFMYVMSFVTVSQFLDNLGFCFLVFFSSFLFYYWKFLLSYPQA